MLTYFNYRYTVYFAGRNFGHYSGSMQKRVLVLDDDKSVCDALDVALSYCKFSVKTSDVPADILGLVEGYNPDILLVDYLLPRVNGAELCHMVKENAATSTIPVVMISAYENNIGEAEADEFDAVLYKPFNLEDLLKTVNHLVDQ